MRRVSLLTVALVAGLSLAPRAQGDGGYRLVSNWPTMPAGMYFGLKDAPPPPAEREAQAAARRATGGQQAAQNNTGGPTNQPGISGLAIGKDDLIYVFNRGPKPVMVFNPAGQMVMSGADQEVNGKTINPNWEHSGTVDWDGNVYVIERDAHRVVKFSPKMDKVLMQIGTTGQKGTDATHLDLPSGIAVLKNGNIIITDGYGNNRVLLYDKAGKLLKQVGKGAGGPNDKGTGVGEWHLPHKLAVDAQENLYIIDRENKRLQVFDRELNYIREIKNEWNPWDIGISRKGTDGYAFIADHMLERVHKMQISDGKLVATWGSQGLGPGQFDWVHGIVVDSQGAVYAADTYGQRLQKFVPGSSSMR
ncbi:MAG TPA: 6-bladed beta-propeller [Vicinamibacterales bacterium]|nr:6-bladed beta-propeller [Vicinamibacterales bacterium]